LGDSRTRSLIGKAGFPVPFEGEGELDPSRLEAVEGVQPPTSTGLGQAKRLHD
jgi:hypothetical protein